MSSFPYDKQCQIARELEAQAKKDSDEAEAEARHQIYLTKKLTEETLLRDEHAQNLQAKLQEINQKVALLATEMNEHREKADKIKEQLDEHLRKYERIEIKRDAIKKRIAENNFWCSKCDAEIAALDTERKTRVLPAIDADEKEIFQLQNEEVELKGLLQRPSPNPPNLKAQEKRIKELGKTRDESAQTLETLTQQHKSLSDAIRESKGHEKTAETLNIEAKKLLSQESELQRAKKQELKHLQAIWEQEDSSMQRFLREKERSDTSLVDSIQSLEHKKEEIAQILRQKKLIKEKIESLIESEKELSVKYSTVAADIQSEEKMLREQHDRTLKTVIPALNRHRSDSNTIATKLQETHEVIRNQEKLISKLAATVNQTQADKNACFNLQQELSTCLRDIETNQNQCQKAVARYEEQLEKLNLEQLPVIQAVEAWKQEHSKIKNQLDVVECRISSIGTRKAEEIRGSTDIADRISFLLRSKDQVLEETKNLSGSATQLDQESCELKESCIIPLQERLIEFDRIFNALSLKHTQLQLSVDEIAADIQSAKDQRLTSWGRDVAPPPQLEEQLRLEADAVMRAQLAISRHKAQVQVRREAENLATIKAEKEKMPLQLDHEACSTLVTTTAKGKDDSQVIDTILSLAQQRHISKEK